jgi:hypothetical protein
VVLAIILVDQDGFGVFEHLLEDFSSYAISRNELYDAIDKRDTNGSMIYKTIKINTFPLDDKISLILVTPENQELQEELESNLLKIASKVAYGDKLAIRHVLQARSEKDFLFI